MQPMRALVHSEPEQQLQAVEEVNGDWESAVESAAQDAAEGASLVSALMALQGGELIPAALNLPVEHCEPLGPIRPNIAVRSQCPFVISWPVPADSKAALVLSSARVPLHASFPVNSNSHSLLSLYICPSSGYRDRHFSNTPPTVV